MDEDRHRHRGGVGVNLRRAAYTRISAVGQANNTTWALKNTSAMQELMLIWSFGGNLGIGAGDVVGFSQQKTIPAFLATATTFPIIPTDAPPPGQLGYFNSLTQFAVSWIWYNTSGPIVWAFQFPFTVLPPGWSLCAQDQTAPTGGIDLSVWWEAMAPEEFEYRYGDTGLAVKRPAGAI